MTQQEYIASILSAAQSCQDLDLLDLLLGILAESGYHARDSRKLFAA